MSCFLRRLSWFLLPVLLLAAAAEWCLCSLPNSYRTKAAAMERLADSVTTLVLGNSHSYYGIRPDQLPGVAVNLANVSQVLPIDLVLLEHYAPLCPRLREVILVCDHSNLFDLPLDSTDECFRMTYYRRYMGICRPAWRLFPDLEILHAESAVGKLRQQGLHPHPDCDALGWGSGYTLERKDPAANTAEAGAVRAGKHTCRDWALARRNADVLRQIAAYCRRQQLCLTILATPVCDSYIDAIPEQQQQFLQDVMQEVSRSYGAAVLDLSRDSTFTAPDFFDVDHLSSEGAMRLTQKLKR